MIPSVVAAEVTGALRDFLATGFGPSNPALAHVVDDFLAEPENLAKGPYLSIALPFLQAPEGGEPFPDIPLGFTPYRHQRTAFSRLAAGAGQSTVVATGTGSGKTECFLYPILDYCRARAGTPGIKAILIYPVNALAADQARRIAQTIDRTPALRGKVTAGVFVGRDNQPQRSAHKTMGRDHVITDRETLRERPPDILLTNYKMLDYLLVRPYDFRLWRHNGPDTLRYLVVDELHTFDGAQGTDLACLIRRLRVRLKVSREKLICAGTSATLGDTGDESELLAYVSRIFDQPFEPGGDRRRGPAEHRRVPRRRGDQPAPASVRRPGRACGPDAASHRRDVRPRAARAVLRRAHRGGLRLRRMASRAGGPVARALGVRESAAGARRRPDADGRHRDAPPTQSPGGERLRGARRAERALRPDVRGTPAGGRRGRGCVAALPAGRPAPLGARAPAHGAVCVRNRRRGPPRNRPTGARAGRTARDPPACTATERASRPRRRPAP